MTVIFGKSCMCGKPAVRVNGRSPQCAQHFRISRMRTDAKFGGKFVPTKAELETLTATMVCPDCTVGMVWFISESGTRVATLQHYRDGTVAVVCKSCNSRHAKQPGDLARDIPADHKWCSRCKIVKHKSEFHRASKRSSYFGIQPNCKICQNANALIWQRKNRDHYNAKQREGRARRKAQSVQNP